MNEYWDKLTNGQKAKLILSIILLVFVLIFAVVNWEKYPINFIFTEVAIPLTLIIIICLLIGYSFSSLYEYKYYQAKVKEIATWKEKVERLETELAAEKAAHKEEVVAVKPAFPPITPSADADTNAH